jgi:hypothetical protein
MAEFIETRELAEVEDQLLTKGETPDLIYKKLIEDIYQDNIIAVNKLEENLILNLKNTLTPLAVRFFSGKI